MATPLKYLPLDTAKLLRPIVMTEGEIKTSRDGEVKKDTKTGLPWWLYGVAVRVEGTRAAAVLTIQTPGEQAGVEPGVLVRLVDLVASPWEMADGSGVTFTAAAIVPDKAAGTASNTATTVPAATGTGRAKAGDAA